MRKGPNETQEERGGAAGVRAPGGVPDTGAAPAGDNPWRRTTRRVAYDNPWVTVYHDEVIRPDGEPGIYGVVHFRSRAVGVLPIDDDRRVLLVGQFRYTLDGYSWEMPEGGGAFDETPLEAAQRELVEETGYTARRWELLCEADLSNSVTDERAWMFVATDLEPGDASPDPTERLELRWIPFDEAMAMIEAGSIRDAMTVIALQRYALRDGLGFVRGPA